MFQVIPPCGGIPNSVYMVMTVDQMFQVIPPCGGIQGDGSRLVLIVVCFKSYPLAGVFIIGLYSYDPTIFVSSHTPLRGYSNRYGPGYGLAQWFQVIPPCGGILYPKST